jgi:DNA-binding NarL/FixJ family response regulator
LKKTKVILIEDEEFTRTTIRTALIQQGLDIVFDTDRVSAAVEFAKRNEIDAAVIDYNLGNGPTGIDAANALRKNDPELGIVLLTAFLNPLQLESKMAKLPRGSKYLIKHSVSEISVLVREIEAAISAKK